MLSEQDLVARLKALLAANNPMTPPPMPEPMPVPQQLDQRLPNRQDLPLQDRARAALGSPKPPAIPRGTPGNPELDQVNAELAGMDNPGPGMGGWKGLLASGLGALKYGSMDPAQAQQLRQQDERQRFTEEETRRENLRRRAAELTANQRQGEQDEIQRQQVARQEELHPLTMRRAGAEAAGAGV